MQTMRAAQVSEDLELEVAEVPRPRPGRGEVLVRVRAAGVCGTDLHILDGMIEPERYPMTLGHETAGVVEAPGESTHVAPGTPVAIYNKLFCGICRQCRTGRQNICDDEPGQLGLNRDGGDADYVVAPERNLVPLPDGVDFATAAVLSCAGMTAVHATRLAGIGMGDVAAVDGIGGVGVMMVQAAKAAGADVLAIADTDDKLALAREHGADDGLVLADADAYDALPERLRGLTDGRGVDAFFELVGTTTTMTKGIQSLAKWGRFVSTGYTDEPLHIHPIEFILPETSFVSTVAATPQDLFDAVTLAASGRLRVPIADTVEVEHLGDALDALRDRRVVGRQVVRFA